MSPYALAAAAIGGIVLAVVLALGGYKAGSAVVQAKWDEAELVRAHKIIVRIKVEKEIETKYVTKWRDRKEAIAVKAEEVKNEIPIVVRADCIVPSDFLLQLHAISRGTTVKDSGRTEDEAAGASCRGVAETLRKAYDAHRTVVAQLNAILDIDADTAKIPDR